MLANAMFPHPPQLFEKDQMVTDDPPGITYWVITHGIRLSGMPGFDKALSETERWQVSGQSVGRLDTDIFRSALQSIAEDNKR
jgi:hypothetical protein